jgi:DNA-binding response OmpR family regulator
VVVRAVKAEGRFPVSYSRSLEGRLILIVEDEPLIALDVAKAITTAGAKVVSAGYLESGLCSTDHPALAAAVVDLRLADGSGTKICEQLRKRRVPFIVHTAYPRLFASAEWPDVPILTKPARPEEIVAALRRLIL